MSSENPLERFLSDDYKEAATIVDALCDRHFIAEEHADALSLALIDIAESANKAYGEFIPRLLESLDADEEELRDVLFDLRSEFRHIDYHIHDADLAEWEWPNLQKQRKEPGIERD